MHQQQIIITPPAAPIDVRIQLPRSKSISNRVLIMSALADVKPELRQLSDAGDTLILQQALAGRPHTIHCGAGGTTLRFLLAWAAMQEGEEHLLMGDARLMERPHDLLVDALIGLGAIIERRPEGFLVRGRRLNGGGRITMHSPISSQYISALMLIAPKLDGGLKIDRQGEKLSTPYLHMTAMLMRHFGITVDMDEDLIVVHPGQYSCDVFQVPADWSAASFWYQIAALSRNARILLEDAFDDGLQGDAVVRDLFNRWVITQTADEGTLLIQRTPTVPDVPVKVDVQDTPDLFLPLAFTYAATGTHASITGVRNLPRKESDRLNCAARILRDLGMEIHVADDLFEIKPLSTTTHFELPVIDPENDHRVAMTAAALAPIMANVRISDPDVIGKSYPRFWDDLAKAGFAVQRFR